MSLYASVDDFRLANGGTTKWDRTLQAIANAGAIEQGVAHSIGDSLTYWRVSAAELARNEFVAHRRYHSVLAVLGGEVRIESAAIADLEPAGIYSDLNDRITYQGTATCFGADAGQVYVVPIDHAWRVLAEPDAELLVLRVTVEGASFHNK